MRYKLNATSRPVTYKTWVIGADQVTTNHLILLKQHDIVARCLFDNEWFTAVDGQMFSYGNNAFAEFETTNTEQESLLMLIYSDKLILKLVETVLPNQMVQYV